MCRWISSESSERVVYLSGENLEELYELLEGNYLDDDEDFNRELESATTVEENVEGKKVYVCVWNLWKRMYTRGKRHETLKHTEEGSYI